MVYAVLSDVEAKWPLKTPTATARATALLEEAHAMLGAELRTLAADVSGGLVDPILVRKVITDAVIRVLVNPTGATGQTLGPEAVQFTGVRALGTLAFTAAELEMLTPATAAASAGGMAIGTAHLVPPRGLERELHPHRYGLHHGGPSGRW